MDSAGHDFVYQGEDDLNHNFACSKCGDRVDFNKPGVGTPNADLSSGTPAFPPDGDNYTSPCTGA